MTIANLINKKIIIATQSAKGTIAAIDAASAQRLRFMKFNQDQTNETYTSDEKRVDRQLGDIIIGPQDGNGACNGELTPETYELFEAAVLRKVFVTGASDAANSDVVAAATSGAAGTFTRSDVAGSWITDKFKLGDVVQMTGWTTTGVTNNTHNFLVTALSATVMTVLAIDGTPPAAKTAGDAITTTVKGQKCWTPATGHTEDWFTIEHNYSDVDLSEVFWDCKPTSMAVKAPATGIPTVDFNILGLQMTAKDNASAPYFTGPTVITTTEVVHSGKAVVLVSGVEQSLATGIDFEIVGNNSAMAPVIGTNVKPGISDGRVEITGNLSILFEDDTIAGNFRAETEVSVFIVLPVSGDAGAEFMAFTIPVVKLTGVAKDGDNGIVQSIPFTAKFNSAGDDGVTCTVNTLATSLSMQDSTLS